MIKSSQISSLSSLSSQTLSSSSNPCIDTLFDLLFTTCAANLTLFLKTLSFLAGFSEKLSFLNFCARSKPEKGLGLELESEIGLEHLRFFSSDRLPEDLD